MNKFLILALLAILALATQAKKYSAGIFKGPVTCKKNCKGECSYLKGKFACYVEDPRDACWSREKDECPCGDICHMDYKYSKFCCLGDDYYHPNFLVHNEK